MPDKLDTSRSLITQSSTSDIILREVQSEQAVKVFTEIAAGANTGVKTAGDAILMYMKARELGIGFGNAIPHMHVISGKVGIDIHVIRALLGKPGSGIKWETIRYYEPEYNYITKDGKIIPYSDLPKNITILSTKDFANATQAGDTIIVTPMPDEKGYKIIDYVTEFKFIRKKRDIDGQFFTTEDFGKFSWKDAVQARLPYDRAGNISEDSPWFKYRQLMIEVRAFTIGARRIASDLLMGVYEKSELYDIEGVRYNLTEDGNATIIED